MNTPANGHPGHKEEQDPSRNSTPQYTQRLPDKILIAFHQACDLGDYEVAGQLLAALETMLRRRPVVRDRRRRDTEAVIAAEERLWRLRHPEAPP